MRKLLTRWFALVAVMATAACSLTQKEAAMSTTPSPLQHAQLCGFAPCSDLARSRQFFEQQLRLRVVSDDGRALMLATNGGMARIQLVGKFTPQHFTVLGWNVSDLAATVAELAAAGVHCEVFGGFPQTPEGIADFPDGTRVAWFKDPDGNILSVAQLAR
jgi:catechol 2,3-dioxygenase-like lactoylglutathione lyase family enzyme